MTDPQTIVEGIEMKEDVRVPTAPGLRGFAPEPPTASQPEALVPSRECDASGSLVIGKHRSLLRNGSYDLILMWEAVKRPVSVDEGGGWYSAHPTDKAWVFRSWMAHKRAPGWAWPKVSDEYNDDLATLLERAFDRAQQRYRDSDVSSAEKPQALSAEHESAAPKADAQTSTPEIEAEISRLQVGGL